MVKRLSACGLATLVLAAPATAGSIAVGLGLVPGKLLVRAAPIRLDSGETASVRVTVLDGRGNGRGWTLRLTGVPGTLTRVVARCAPRSTCTLPTALRAPSGTALRAAPGTGMGAIVLDLTLRARAAGRPAFSIG